MKIDKQFALSMSFLMLLILIMVSISIYYKNEELKNEKKESVFCSDSGTSESITYINIYVMKDSLLNINTTDSLTTFQLKIEDDETNKGNLKHFVSRKE